MIIGNDPCDLERRELPEGVSLHVSVGGKLYPAWQSVQYPTHVWCAVGVVAKSSHIVVKYRKGRLRVAMELSTKLRRFGYDATREQE